MSRGEEDLSETDSRLRGVRLIVARCEVTYSGRLSAVLPEAATGIAATATGYVSAAVRNALPQARVLPLVVECGTLDGATVSDAVQAEGE